MGSDPGWVDGYRPNAAEWNSWFAVKQDQGSNTADTFLVGTGTTTGFNYTFQVAQNTDPVNTDHYDIRRNMFQTTLTYSAATTNIWQNLTSYLFVNGPGAANGEINGVHAYQEYRAGSTVQAAEGYESSVWNRGTISGYHIGYLALVTNDVSATAQYFYGMQFQFINNNSAAGSVGNYFAIDNEGRSGTGSVPTNYGFIRNNDPAGRISSLGALGLGDLGSPPAGALLYVRGTDTSSGTLSVRFYNSALTEAFRVDNAGNISSFVSHAFGSGTKSGLGYEFQTAMDYNPAVMAAINRRTNFQTTLNYSTANTTNIWEGVTAFTTINGPFQANGEVNNFHGNMTVAVGATAQTTTIYEAKIENRGTISGANTNFQSLSVNYAGATASYLHGMDIQLQNLNASAGSIGNYIGINFSGLSGGGSVPTNYRFIRSSDGTAPSTIMGNVSIGSLAAGGGQGSLYVYGADNSGGTFPFFVKSNTGTFNALYVDNAGTVHFAADAASVANNGAINSNTNYKISGVQVMGARITGWNAPSGTLLRGTFNSGTATLTDVAQTLAALITDSRTQGFINT